VNVSCRFLLEATHSIDDVAMMQERVAPRVSVASRADTSAALDIDATSLPDSRWLLVTVLMPRPVLLAFPTTVRRLVFPEFTVKRLEVVICTVNSLGTTGPPATVPAGLSLPATFVPQSILIVLPAVDDPVTHGVVAQRLGVSEQDMTLYGNGLLGFRSAVVSCTASTMRQALTKVPRCSCSVPIVSGI